jgi:hypothetical protein
MLAKKGRKPKAAIKRQIEGNRGHSAIPDEGLLNGFESDNPEGGLEPPIKLKAREKKLWDEVVRFTPWLKDKDRHIAMQWLRMAIKVEDDQLKPSQVREFRMIGSQLGFDPGSRTSMAFNIGRAKDAGVGAKPVSDKKDDVEELFGKAAN